MILNLFTVLVVNVTDYYYHYYYYSHKLHGTCLIKNLKITSMCKRNVENSA